MMHDGLYHDDRTIYNDTEVYGAQAHQVGTYSKKLHHAQGKEQGERNGSGHNQPCTQVAQEKHQDKDNNQGTL